MTKKAIRHIVFLPLSAKQFGGSLGILRHSLIRPREEHRFLVQRAEIEPKLIWFAGSGDIIAGVRRKFWLVRPTEAEPLLKTLSFKEDFDLVANALQQQVEDRKLRSLVHDASTHALRELKALERLAA